MSFAKLCAVSPVVLGLAGCVTAGPIPGTPEYAAAQVSRGYDCGVRVDRSRVIARLAPQERRRFVEANAGYAVKSYNAPRRCDALERLSVQRELRELAVRR
ncbi:hypothetical protein DWF00_22975 [Bosea caraganae]|uniref:Lipoprotein n=1 Tax=Bosea caraganae TaxID=2763117 RepID=A0A370L1T6_9HYPH|nr:hypothetical protein [Bosea caraganae]RDJ21516.1 hypothetical protein DWE98_21040 [Bosea caraganae]RDJ23484.1 hypothetical protein DWF00_22975 [Bosea caraganae]